MIAHKKKKIVKLLVLAWVMVCLIIAQATPVFASEVSPTPNLINDDNLKPYTVSAYASILDSDSPSWTSRVSIPSNSVSIILDEDGFYTIRLSNLSSLFSTGHIYRLTLEFVKISEYPSSSGSYNPVTMFDVSNFSVTSSFQAYPNSDSSFTVSSSNLPSTVSSPFGFLSYYSSGGVNNDIISSSSLSRQQLVSHYHSFSSPVNIGRSICVQWSGFDAFGNVDFVFKVKLSINDESIFLINSISSFDDTLSSFNPLWEDLQTFNNSLPTFGPADLATAESIAISVFPQNTGTLFSFMNTELVTYIFILVVFFTVLSIIIFGHSGG